MDVLWGLLVIVATLGASIALVLWGLSSTPEPVTAPTVVVGDVLDPGEAQIIVVEPLIIDTRAVEPPQIVVDALGEWKPWEHTLDEPMILGHVLMSRPWPTLDAAELGMRAR